MGIFLCEKNNTKQYDFHTFRKPTKGAMMIIPWENWQTLLLPQPSAFILLKCSPHVSASLVWHPHWFCNHGCYHQALELLQAERDKLVTNFELSSGAGMIAWSLPLLVSPMVFGSSKAVNPSWSEQDELRDVWMLKEIEATSHSDD